MKISIIIPVYRCAATLDRCVRSVAAQEGASMEIILVDDGSPDDCPAICDRWARDDERIVAVHKSNGGLSDARNAGIERATGERLMFVDADDFLMPGTIGSLADILREHPEYDILEFPVSRMHGSPQQQTLSFGNRIYRSMKDYWLEGRAYTHSYACNKIYARRLFDGVRYPAGRVFEDIYTLPALLGRADVVATTDRGLYCYTYNSDGITATAGPSAHRMLLEAHMRIVGGMDITSVQEQNYYMHVLNIQIYENELTDDRPVLKTRRIDIARVDRQFRLKAILVNVLGVGRLCAANRIMRRIIGRKRP